jgi:hypothetical protein
VAPNLPGVDSGVIYPSPVGSATFFLYRAKFKANNGGQETQAMSTGNSTWHVLYTRTICFGFFRWVGWLV